MSFKRSMPVALLMLSVLSPLIAEELPPPDKNRQQREAEYYRLTDIPFTDQYGIEASSFLELDDGRIAVGTRRGDIFFVDGIKKDDPDPEYRKFASGLHEVFGLAWKDGILYAVQQCEVTRVLDTNQDGRADRFETVSDGWGFGGEHEFTYGTGFDREGFLWTVHCLTGSYTSESLFRGWCLRIAPDGTTIPTCSGLRSPGGIGMNSLGDMFYTENQGPWNGACSLKHLKPGGFLGHPVSFPWYAKAPEMGPVPEKPNGGREHRQYVEADRIPQLVPPAVVFPYRRMGQSASAIMLDRSSGKFGPFSNQMFVADYTLSLVMRVDLEEIDGVYQGACFPFREGFNTGLVGGILTTEGQLFAGGCSRGWPARGPEPFGLQRLEWTGKNPFEVHSVRIQPDGFVLHFTEALDPETAANPDSYRVASFTHYYQAGYGSPEVDQKDAMIQKAQLLPDGKSVRLVLNEVRRGHVHEIHCDGVRNEKREPLLHAESYYTVNRVPKK